MKLDFYISKFPDLRVLYRLVEEDFTDRGLIHHNWHHILRDLARAVIVGEAEKADMKVVLAGVLLHDIGRLHPLLGRDHYESGAKIAPKNLEESGFTNEEREEIIHCIKAHGPRGLEEPKTIEAKTVYDVDVLSCSVGYIGVARVFDYFMREEEMGVKEMLNIPSGIREPRKNFYTETGETLGEQGLKKAREFWETLRQELKKEEETVRGIIPEYKGD
jgi:HD superfamily phosphodiesterase